MVDCGLDRLNEYHLISLWHTCSKEFIIIRSYNWKSWRCGIMGKLVLVMEYVVMLHVLVIPIIILSFFSYYGFYFSLWLKPWLLFPVDYKVEYLQDLVD